MSGRRKVRAEAAKATLEILEAGRYTSPSGREVSVLEQQRLAVERARHFSPEALSLLLDRAPVDPISRRTTFEVTNETTLAASRRILCRRGGRVACLNFASAKNPGGGFLSGSSAQEESLAVASGLYPTLTKFDREYYAFNRRNGTCLYSDNLIYSPDVPFFRDDKLALLEEPFCVSVVTCPAINAGHLKGDEQLVAEEVMVTRMRKILAVLRDQRHTQVVLGAYGCGVFRNPCQLVANYFGNLLLPPSGEFSRAFDHVSFAVLDRSPSLDFVKPFARKFDVSTTT